MSRDEILRRIKQNKPELKPLRFEDETAISSRPSMYKDFIKNLHKVGAKTLEINEKTDPELYLLKHYPDAIDFTKEEQKSQYPPDFSNDKPDKLETIILEGQFGVSENGAIWLNDFDFQNRIIPFISKHLIIKLKKESLVANMHEAYKRIDIGNTGFGVFISGPSKTADIEQSLVYGAHGPVQLFVCLY